MNTNLRNIMTETTSYDLKPQEHNIRQFGIDMMDLAFFESEDTRANKMSDLGSRLSRFGDAWSIKIGELTEEELKLIEYAKLELKKTENIDNIKMLVERRQTKIKNAIQAR